MRGGEIFNGGVAQKGLRPEISVDVESKGKVLLLICVTSVTQMSRLCCSYRISREPRYFQYSNEVSFRVSPF